MDKSPSLPQTVEPLADTSEFPVLRDLTYLNTASIGLVPASVQREAREIEAEIASRGTTWFDEEVETGILERARMGASRLLNAPPDQIAITSSATEALAQVAWMLRPGSGTNVVSVDLEFPSVTYPWLRLAAETGAEVRLAEYRETPEDFDLNAIEALVDDSTAVICVSHVQYSTGACLPLTELSDLARKHRAALVIDATQSAGHVPIDLSLPGVEVTAMVSGGYKWLCGPFGAAFCYLSSGLLDGVEPPFVGWRSAPDPYSMDAAKLSLASSAKKLEFSTMSYSAAVALGAAIEFVLALDIDRVHDHARALGDRLRQGLEGLGATILTPGDAGQPGGTTTVRFPGRDGSSIVDLLNRSRVVVSPRAGAVRFSAHFFNGSADVDQALSVAEFVLAEGRPADA